MANYKLLEPSLDTVTSGKVSFDTSSPSATSAIETTTFLMFTAIFLAGAGVLAYGGFQFVMTFSTTVKGEARETIKRAIFGILGVLGMWLFLMQVNPDMLKGDLLPSTIKQGTATTPSSQPATTGDDIAMQTILSTELSKRTKLVGVIVTSTKGGGACTYISQKGCTSIGGLDDSAIDVLNSLKQDCGGGNCSVAITGGTEWWAHSSGTLHRPGNAVFDLNCNHPIGRAPCTTNGDRLNTFLESLPKGPARGGLCSEVYLYKNFNFCNETIAGNSGHWHIQPQDLSTQKNFNP